MERAPKVATGTYGGWRFYLEDIDEFQECKEFSMVKKTRGYYIVLVDSGEMTYVKADDPLLKFDPIKLED